MAVEETVVAVPRAAWEKTAATRGAETAVAPDHKLL